MDFFNYLIIRNKETRIIINHTVCKSLLRSPLKECNHTVLQVSQSGSGIFNLSLQRRIGIMVHVVDFSVSHEYCSYSPESTVNLKNDGLNLAQRVYEYLYIV